MVELIAKSAADGLLPVSHGGMTLREIEPLAISAVMPFADRVESVERALGVAFPGPGGVTGTDDLRLVWTGVGQALALGRAIGEVEGAAVVAQDGAWACLALEGAAAADVLARLVPVDLRASVFAPRNVVRTLLGHMQVILIREDAQSFTILVFRSMTATALHEIGVAMKSVAASGGPRLF